jgi:hypothetical protein
MALHALQTRNPHLIQVNGGSIRIIFLVLRIAWFLLLKSWEAVQVHMFPYLQLHLIKAMGRPHKEGEH